MADVLVTSADGVMTVTLNRPAAKNAMNYAMAVRIAAAMDELDERDDLAIAVIAGSGGAFCAGMDLKAFAQGERPTIVGRGFAGLTEKPPSKPLIAAVEGWALAGGCELALAADIVVAARTARFGIPEVKRGLVAAAGGLLRLPRVLPYSLAMTMALTGDPIDAEIAEKHGLVSVLTEHAEAYPTALNLASRIAQNGPLAVRVSKQIMSEHIGWSSADSFTRQRELFTPVFDSEDAMEGARAFAEKRAPQWQGR